MGVYLRVLEHFIPSVRIQIPGKETAQDLGENSHNITNSAWNRK